MRLVEEAGQAAGVEAAAAPRVSGAQRRAGRILQVLVGVFMLFDGGARLIGFAPYIEGTTRYGYAESMAPWIALLLLFSTVLYLVPRTAVPGAVLLAAYLGGATASHVRVGEPFFFPVLMGVLAWVALYLLDPELRALLHGRRLPPGS
jgi:hypothetical protein